MAVRGRGRGRVTSLPLESLGFGRGESLPATTLQPPPVFPVLEFKPVPLLQGDEYDYMLALKQEYSGTMKASPYFIKEEQCKQDIYRYSDKYQLGSNDNWHIDWSRVPCELKPQKKKVKMPVKPKVKVAGSEQKIDLVKALEVLEKKELAESEGKGDGEASDGEENEEGGVEDNVYDEEEFDEETDYNMTYFDNGETFGYDDDDDLDEHDGPTY